MSITSEITVRRVAGSLGAELAGLTLSGALDDATVAGIREAVLTHKVVFIRDQHQLDEADHAAFARRLGPLTTAHPTVPAHESNEHILDITAREDGRGRANSWHTDVTFVNQPPSFSVLRGVTIPGYGGDTVWANTAAAYASLPEELRDLVDRLWAVHTNAFDYARADLDSNGELDQARLERAAVFQSTEYETLHPVVRVHPETGERALLLGGFARRIAGWPEADSTAFIRLLQDRITGLENTVRWSWREGDVVIWDNRATQHYAVADYGDQARTVRRITITGEIPVAVDGRTSQAKKGDAAEYNFA